VNTQSHHGRYEVKGLTILGGNDDDPNQYMDVVYPVLENGRQVFALNTFSQWRQLMQHGCKYYHQSSSIALDVAKRLLPHLEGDDPATAKFPPPSAERGIPSYIAVAGKYHQGGASEESSLRTSTSSAFSGFGRVSAHDSEDSGWKEFLMSNDPAIRSKGAETLSAFEMLRATSAAPTMFAPLEKDGEVYTDGCVVANNPTLLAVQAARKRWPNRPINCVLSIGTCIDNSTATVGAQDALNGGAMYWVNQMVNQSVDGEHVHRHVQSLLAELQALPFQQGHPIRCFRVQGAFDTIPVPDESSKAVLAAFTKNIEAYIEDNRETFLRIANILKQPSQQDPSRHVSA
jgi:hypothetical protein